MPEQVHKISITKKIDLNSGNSLKTLERFTKAAGQARIAAEKLKVETSGSRAASKNRAAPSSGPQNDSRESASRPPKPPRE